MKTLLRTWSELEPEYKVKAYEHLSLLMQGNTVEWTEGCDMRLLYIDFQISSIRGELTFTIEIEKGV